MDQIKTAREVVQHEIERWTGKARINCERDTLVKMVQSVGGGVTTLLATGAMIVRASVQVPPWIGVVLGIVGALVGTVITVATQISTHHEYGTRWRRIREQIEAMQWELYHHGQRSGSYRGLTESEADALLLERCGILHSKAWGWAASAPIPQQPPK